MKEEPDSLSVPYNFARCLNAQCPQASKCLRHIATQLDTTDNLYITIINPARYPADGNQCECFKTAVKVHGKHPIKYPFSLLYFHCTFAFAILHELLTYFHYDTRTI